MSDAAVTTEKRQQKSREEKKTLRRIVEMARMNADVRSPLRICNKFFIELRYVYAYNNHGNLMKMSLWLWIT